MFFMPSTLYILWLECCHCEIISDIIKKTNVNIKRNFRLYNAYIKQVSSSETCACRNSWLQFDVNTVAFNEYFIEYNTSFIMRLSRESWIINATSAYTAPL